MTENTLFKECSMCKQIWQNRETFLDDIAIELNGYSADFEEMGNGLFFFTHKIPGCKSTMAVQAKEFFDLYTGKKYNENKRGGEECPRFCLERENLKRCPVFCEHAFVREILQAIITKQKSPSREPAIQEMNGGIYNVTPK
jgi:hypothetical protein